MKRVISLVLICNISFAQTDFVMDCSFYMKAAEVVINNLPPNLQFSEDYSYILLNKNMVCESEENSNFTTKYFKSTISTDSLKLKVLEKGIDILEIDEVKIYKQGVLLIFFVRYYYPQSEWIQEERFEVTKIYKTNVFIPFATNEFVILE